MLLLVFSDTHGVTSHMYSAIARLRPDAVVHLGDCYRDCADLTLRFPHTQLFAVTGNCDYAAGVPESLSFRLGGVGFFAAHGHRYRVKLEPDCDALCNAASLAGADVALFGHTHIPLLRREGKLLLMNPGTAGLGTRPTCGRIFLPENGSPPELSILPLEA
jgi:putative phosphoesterase